MAILDHSNCVSLFWTDAFAKELQFFFTTRVKCPETAADLTHETYLRMHKSMSQSPTDNARALAFSIAVNLCIDYQRRLNTRNQYMTDLSCEESSESVADFSFEPLRSLISQERYTSLQAALTELPADCRTVFILNRVENLTYQEIAERLGISRSTVGRLLERAIMHCTKRLDL